MTMLESKVNEEALRANERQSEINDRLTQFHSTLGNYVNQIYRLSCRVNN